MFTKKEINGLIKELKNFVRNVDYIDLFCLHGSRAAGRATKESDIDFYILFKGNANKIVPKLFHLIDKKTSLDKKEYFLKIRFADFYGSHFELNGKGVSIHFLETNVFERKLKSLFKNEDNFKKYQYYARGWILEAIPLYNPKKLFKKFKKYCKFNIKFQKDLINKKISALKLILPFAKKTIKNAIKRGVYTFYFDLDELIRLIIDTIYLRNKAFQFSYHKTLKQDLKKFKPNIEKGLKYIIEKPNEKHYMQRKINVVQEIIKKLK